MIKVRMKNDNTYSDHNKTATDAEKTLNSGSSTSTSTTATDKK